MPATILMQGNTAIPVFVTGGSDVGATGPAGPPGDVAKANLRSDVEAVAGPAAKATRWLAEAGREGLFVFDSSNLSAKVTADPNQGLYIAPAAAPTGASGAWVRQFDGAVNVRWFGAKGDNATDDGPAFLAALAATKVFPANTYGYGTASSRRLYAPHANYYLGTTTLDIFQTVIIEGDGCGESSAGATVLRWADNTTGIRIHAHNTTGASGTRASANDRGDGTIIRNLMLRGGYAGTESESHGIHLRGHAEIRDVYITNFGGDGIFSRAAAGSGGATEGNANTCYIDKVFVQGCRNGLYLDSADTNACQVTAFNAIANRMWGVWDSSFLGNTYIGCHTAGNGWDGAAGSIPTASVLSGNRYYVKEGQAVGASTNSPSGTTADNTWWGYISAGGVYSGVVAWVSGTTFREGGAYHADANANAANVIVGCYAEGDQNPSVLNSACLRVGGSMGIVKGSGQITAAGDRVWLNNITTPGGLLATGAAPAVLGPNTGTATDSTVEFNNTNIISSFVFTSYLGGAPSVDGHVFSWRGNGLVVNGAPKIILRTASVARAYLNSTEFTPDVTNTLDLGLTALRWKTVFALTGDFTTQIKVNGVKILGAQGAAVADATDAASVIARLNDLLARLRAHGVIAT